MPFVAVQGDAVDTSTAKPVVAQDGIESHDWQLHFFFRPIKQCQYVMPVLQILFALDPALFVDATNPLSSIAPFQAAAYIET